MGRPLLADVPVWLAEWRRPDGRHLTRYIPAKTAGSAADLCELAGLGRPDAVSRAGYSAAPGTPPEPVVKPKPKNGARPRRHHAGNRAETGLMLYASLRVDWPVGSILADREAAHRVSSPVLRDFLANVGAALERLEEKRRAVVLDFVEAQGRAWWYAGQAKNAKREHRHRDRERFTSRANVYRRRVKRLRDRPTFQRAIDELHDELAGATEQAERARVRFLSTVIEFGCWPADAKEFVEGAARVSVPRL